MSKLLDLFTAASLLLFVATAVLWVRGRSHWDDVSWSHRAPIRPEQSVTGHDNERSITWAVGSRLGQVYVFRVQEEWRFEPTFDVEARQTKWDHLSQQPDSPPPYLSANGFDFHPAPGWQWMGFAVNTDPERLIAARYISVMVPCWFLILVAALLPFYRLSHVLRQSRRRTNGACPRCGYDLRACKDRCPECGKPIPGK